MKRRSRRFRCYSVFFASHINIFVVLFYVSRHCSSVLQISFCSVESACRVRAVREREATEAKTSATAAMAEGTKVRGTTTASTYGCVRVCL